MGFLSAFFTLLCFGIGIILGTLIGYFIFIFIGSRPVKDQIARQLDELNAVRLHELLSEIPPWVKNPDIDRVDWFNKLLTHKWTYLDKAVCSMIRDIMKQISVDYVGKFFIDSVEFGTLTLGTFPPTVQGIKVHDTREKDVIFEPVIKWAGNCNITLVVKVFTFRLTIKLVDLHIFLSPRIILKPLVPTFPCFAGISISLLEKPNIDFGLHVMGGDIMSIPGLYQYLQKLIKEQVGALYLWPKTLDLPILDNLSGVTRKPVGILHVKVVRAFNLRKMDIWGKSDPYVMLSLMGERLTRKKTTIKMKNLNPEWDEKFKFLVREPETQKLQLHVYDWEKVGQHDKLGMQVIPLSLLVPHETKEFTLDLVKSLNHEDSQNKRQRGQIVVELTLDPFKDEMHRFSGPLERDGIEYSSNSHLADVCNGGVLLVVVQGATNVEGKYHTNPYAVIILRGEKKKTKVIRRSQNPMWNEEFQFMLEDAPVSEKLHIEVMNKKRGAIFRSKASLGYVEINLKDVVMNGRINEKYHLVDSRNGVIHVEIRWIEV